MSVQEIYTNTVRPLAAQDRLRLASLILDGLAAADVDVSDRRSDQDMEDLTKFTEQSWAGDSSNVGT